VDISQWQTPMSRFLMILSKANKTLDLICTPSSTQTRRGGSLMSSTKSSWPLTYSLLLEYDSPHMADEVSPSLLLVSQSVTSPPRSAGMKLAVLSSRTALSAATGGGEGGRQLHTNVGSVICPCVLYHVLSFTTQRGTHRGTCLKFETWYSTHVQYALPENNIHCMYLHM